MPNALRDRTCVTCGRPFTGGNRALYCGLACKRRAHAGLRPSRAKPRATRSCEECWEPFVAARSSHRYCSGRCSGRARYAATHADPEAGAVRRCRNPDCDQSVAPNRRLYCSGGCGSRWSYLNGSGRDRKRHVDRNIRKFLRAPRRQPPDARSKLVCQEPGCITRINDGDLCRMHWLMKTLLREKSSA